MFASRENYFLSRRTGNRITTTRSSNCENCFPHLLIKKRAVAKQFGGILELKP
uniref:Uncharacterized protein n=1 Tax=Lotus japonicus TaxID=34305 RepID=I3T5S0_LOTJA|nr:unknown [Lotus japonicus]